MGNLMPKQQLGKTQKQRELAAQKEKLKNPRKDAAKKERMREKEKETATVAKDLKMDMAGMNIDGSEMQKEFKKMMQRKNSSFMNFDDSDSEGSKEDNLERAEMESEELKDDLSSDSMTDMVRQPPSSNGDYLQNNPVMMYTNMQDQFLEIIDNDEVEDVIDLNEKFLSLALGVDVDELATLPKIELRVDTQSHFLQVTGEILSSLNELKLNDSIIRSFRDLGTSFKNL